MASLNVNSLLYTLTAFSRNIDELRVWSEDQTFDLLAINESKLDDKINDGSVSLNGYEILRKDRNRNGGGVALYLRTSINYVNRSDLLPKGI